MLFFMERGFSLFFGFVLVVGLRKVKVFFVFLEFMEVVEKVKKL